MIADTETAMNAVERTQHYTELEAEPQTCGGGGAAAAAPSASGGSDLVDLSHWDGVPADVQRKLLLMAYGREGDTGALHAAA